MSSSVIRAITFLVVGLYIIQLPRSSSGTTHSSVIFQVQISYTPVIPSSCPEPGSYCLKPNFNACCQHISRCTNFIWDKLNFTWLACIKGSTSCLHMAFCYNVLPVMWYGHKLPPSLKSASSEVKNFCVSKKARWQYAHKGKEQESLWPQKDTISYFIPLTRRRCSIF